MYEPDEQSSRRAISWNILSAIVGGRSAIDVPRLYVRDELEATRFLHSYGFDWSDPAQRDELEWLRTESLALIEEELLPDPFSAHKDSPRLVVPAEVRGQRDVRRLLLMASAAEDAPPVARELQRWACALLRVMHTLAHTQMVFNDQYGQEIRAQILGRVEPHLRGTAEGGDLRLGDGPDAIPLAGFEIKHTKPLRSVALKLLHKAENVAADIFDRIGMRFITRERYDALLVVHYLRVHHIVMFANIKPSRSRNTMIDLDWLRERVDALDEALRHGEITPGERLQRLRAVARDREVPAPPVLQAANAFTASSYRSIQFTCRQQIRIRDPLGQQLAEMATAAEARLGPDDALVAQLRQRADQADQGIRFFFPFEIQIIDESDYCESRSGRASYQDYKARQRAAARARVLGSLLDAADAEAWPPPAPVVEPGLMAAGNAMATPRPARPTTVPGVTFATAPPSNAALVAATAARHDEPRRGS